MRPAIDGAGQTLGAFVMERYRRAAIEQAWDEFMAWDGPAFDPESPLLPIFMPWLYHSWNPDPYEDLTAVPEPLIGRPPTPELHFGDDVLVPNLAGWRRERLPSTPNEPYLTLAPDWICEVLSPSTEYIDRGKKLRIYAREGVGHAWLVDPLRQTLEVLALEAGSLAQIAEHHGGDSVRALPFDAVELELRALWS